VLVTDGVNNAGAIDPMSAATVCKGLGIKVYTVGVGTAGRVPVPISVQNPFTGQREVRRVMMNVKVDDQLLERIANKTGGQFYRATDSTEMRRIFAQIDHLEKSRIKVKQYVRYREAFQPLAWAALAFLLLPLATTALRVSVEP
ncbi:MAG TPA: VWA domain-containing protein, partial [Thermoanaerobaculia bacterium]|nr:VWA domain-containing protein [Thermoanaerobaculia bacterium]